MTSSTADVFAHVEQEKGRFLEELKDYLRIPSISTARSIRRTWCAAPTGCAAR